MSTPAAAAERRRRARAMVDEDDALPVASSSSNRVMDESALKGGKGSTRSPQKGYGGLSPAPSSSTSRPRTASNSAAIHGSPSRGSPKLLVKLNGRVYRQKEEGDPRTAEELEADLLLSEPTETIEDLEQERRAERRRQVELEIKREKLKSPGKGKGRVLTFDDSDEEQEEKLSSPKKASRTSLLGTPGKVRSSPSVAQPTTPPPKLSFDQPQPTSPSPALGLPFSHPFSPRSAKAAQKDPLPPPLAALLSLHSAVERSLIMHLSLAGSGIASTSSEVDPITGEAVVRMMNLIDLPTLSKMLVSTGKRFGEDDLRRLVWLWEGCDGLAGEEALAGRCKSEDEAGGMGFVVTRARMSSAAGARISGTYGLGILVGVKANPQLPKFELVSPGRKTQEQQVPPPSPSSVGKGREGMSIVALWTQGKEQRQAEAERRLRAWSKATSVKREEGGEPVESDDTITFDWTVSTSSQSSSLLGSLPRASLPLLNPGVPALASTLTPSPKKPSASTGLTPSTANLPVASPEKFVESLLAGKPIKGKGGKAVDRAAAMRERIQAKQDAQKRSAYHASLSSLSSGEVSPTKRSLKPHGNGGPVLDPDSEQQEYVSKAELYKRNAMLSRLPSVADVVAMRCSARPTRFDEVCTAVANSPLLAIGFDESDQSLTFLSSAFPEFCYIKLVNGSERWICLAGGMRALEVKAKVREELARVAEEMKHQ